MLIGYARVSTRTRILTCRNKHCKLPVAKNFHRHHLRRQSRPPGLDEALEFIRKGDTLVVWADRLGRSIRHLIETVQLLNDRKIGFKSLQECIDTTTSGGKLIFHIFGALAEFERDLIRERTQAGLQAARARGRNGGRPQKLTGKKLKLFHAMRKNPEHSVGDICAAVGISKATYYRYVEVE